MPPTSPCEGCCVKMVQFIGTDHYQVLSLNYDIDRLDKNINRKKYSQFFYGIIAKSGTFSEAHKNQAICF